jgi:hypothetical protein
MKLNHLLFMTLLSFSLAFTTLFASTDAIYAHAGKTLIQPSDGTWKATVASNDVQGCPSMMKSMLSKETLPSKSKAMVFSTPFDPASLFDEAKDLKWESVGINQWKAVIIQAQGTLNMSIQWFLAVNTEEKMAVHSLIEIDYPKEMIAILGGTGKCTVDMIGHFNLMK